MVFYSSTITMMHGPINIRFTVSVIRIEGINLDIFTIRVERDVTQSSLFIVLQGHFTWR